MENRVIKFRAWDGNRILDNDDIGGLCISDLSNGLYESVMQFTGLTDKKGKEVYQGDILRTPNHKEGNKIIYNYHSVVWRERINGWFCLNTHDKTENEQNGSCMLFVYNKNANFEVIGNIHENKELLDEKI